MTEPASNVALVLQTWEAFWRGDIEAGLANLHADATWLVPGAMPASGLKRGHAEIAAFRRGNISTFAKIERQVRAIHSAENFVAIESIANGVLHDGRAYENAGCVIWELRDGKIAHVREYIDTHKAMAIAGLSGATDKFSASRLMEEAKSRSGLDDFGDDYFRAGLEQFVKCVNRELKLTTGGVVAVRERALTYLTNRLQIEDWYRRHPEIDDQQIVAPVFGLGLPRTGSTLLQCLIQQDRQTRSLRTWESKQPCPPPEAATRQDDPRIAAAAANWAALTKAAPEILAMLPLEGPEDPTECQDLLGLSFRSSAFVATMMFGYLDWLSNCDMAPAYAYHRRALKLLQWRCPPTRWRLKSPIHMLNMEALAATYPDARFVITHRDVAQSIPSMAALVVAIGKLFVEELDPERVGLGSASLWERAMARLAAFRAGSDMRFYDMRFDDLQADPIGAVRNFYQWLGEPMRADHIQAIETWLALRRRGKHGENRIDLADYGLDATALRRRLEPFAAKGIMQ
jgi:ketosteroid isomerase-like protein